MDEFKLQITVGSLMSISTISWLPINLASLSGALQNAVVGVLTSLSKSLTCSVFPDPMAAMKFLNRTSKGSKDASVRAELVGDDWTYSSESVISFIYTSSEQLPWSSELWLVGMGLLSVL